MTFADIRSRLASPTTPDGPAYWRSLDELANTEEFQDFVAREFPSQASEFSDPAGRRQFLKLMGASLALAGVSACTRQPEELLVPYVRQPEEVIPGRPLFFATTMTEGGFGMPLLAENHLGRPTSWKGIPNIPRVWVRPTFLDRLRSCRCMTLTARARFGIGATRKPGRGLRPHCRPCCQRRPLSRGPVFASSPSR